MNARWQQAVVLVNTLATIAWLAWQWPRSPLTALAGVAAALALFGLVLGLQFATMLRVNRSDPAPRPPGWQLVTAWWAEARLALAVFGWRQPFRHSAIPDWLPPLAPNQRATRRGVVLVHGFLCNRGFWLPWMAALRERGHAFVAVTLEPAFGSIDDYAATIDAAVQRMQEATGLAPVVVGHSMGGLAARAWLRSLAADSATARVHRVITLGTPHGGAWAGRFSRSVNGQQMALGGAWVRQLQQGEPPARAGLFTCWYSNCDNIVFPAGTAMLAGADNRLVQGVAHMQMAFHPVVMRACLEEMG
ncbi:esterase/lipase family protein [Acidovorax soli]|uniref:esterase/lipase family protein n=1 Tax=Acidovorax TaxID=12916 RepID=UPI0026F1EDA8|nr:alpha/beta fold hydrolase [Acidovorax soli]MCM2348275.1 alpha/beta fold hydrolase [Acidovorax soli]